MKPGPSFACRLWTLLAAGMVCLAACQSHSATPESPRSVIAQWSGPHGGPDAPATRVLRTSEEWNAFWRQVDRPRPRDLDVTREMAVVIQLGQKRTGGFGAEILDARTENGSFLVEFRTISPEPGMRVTQELTSPWVVGVFARTNLPVVTRDTRPMKPTLREK